VCQVQDHPPILLSPSPSPACARGQASTCHEATWHATRFAAPTGKVCLCLKPRATSTSIWSIGHPAISAQVSPWRQGLRAVSGFIRCPQHLPQSTCTQLLLWCTPLLPLRQPSHWVSSSAQTAPRGHTPLVPECV